MSVRHWTHLAAVVTPLQSRLAAPLAVRRHLRGVIPERAHHLAVSHLQESSYAAVLLPSWSHVLCHPCYTPIFRSIRASDGAALHMYFAEHPLSMR